MLKLIALLTMIIDHIGYFWDVYEFRVIGRLSFPIYCFLVVKGIENSRDLNKYMWRMLRLGVISHMVWYYIGYAKLNVLFTYAIFIKIVDLIKKKKMKAATLAILAIVIISPQIDYGLYGFMVLLIFYLNKNMYKVFGFILMITLWSILNGYRPMVSVLAAASVFIISTYDKQRYYDMFKKYNKLFYIAYPVHLILLVLLRYSIDYI